MDAAQRDSKVVNRGMAKQSGGLGPCSTASSTIRFGIVSEEVTLNWNKWIRQTHRWLSIAFTLAIIINGVAVVQGRYNSKLGLVAVVPLALEFFTGMYLFVLPYAAKWRGRRRAS
jgi:hypothetical protein